MHSSASLFEQMIEQIDRWTDLMRCGSFCRVVERRSFTLAAEDLGLPRSTVTDAVQAVGSAPWRAAARSGPRARSARRSTAKPITSAACRSLPISRRPKAPLRGAEPKGLLRVDVHGTLARHFVLPSLPSFLETYPDIEFYMSEGDRLVDLVREGIDCVLRVGVPQDSDMIARRVATLEEITLASPAYHRTPRHAGTSGQARRPPHGRLPVQRDGRAAAARIHHRRSGPQHHRSQPPSRSMQPRASMRRHAAAWASSRCRATTPNATSPPAS